MHVLAIIIKMNTRKETRNKKLYTYGGGELE